MTHTMITIQPDGTRSEQYGKPELAALQREVGGYIEEIGYFTKFEGHRCTAYANEDGLMMLMPRNTPAMKLWADQYTHASVLVGPVVIVVKGPLSA